MADNAKHLEAIFLKGNLNKTDVLNLLAGHRVRLSKSYGDSTVHNLVTGNAVVGSKATDIIERWVSLKEIWESSEHGRTSIQLKFDPKADDLIAPLKYVIRWAGAKHRGTSKLFEGFRECILYGLKQSWITPQDFAPVEETPKEEKPKEPEPVKDTLLNPEALIYALKDMLNDADLIDKMHNRVHQTKDRKAWSNQDQLVNYLTDKYSKDKPQKGLSKSKVQKAFAKANKKWDEIERN
jgi:hypothetical protein